MNDKDTSDFYIRYEDHPNYNPDIVQVSDPIDVLVNKIEMILFTNQGDILGELKLGANLEHYVHKTNVNDQVIKDNLEEQFNLYLPEIQRVSYSIDVVFMEDTTRYIDVALISIDVAGKNITALIA